MKKIVISVLFCIFCACALAPTMVFAESTPVVSAKEAILTTCDGQVLFEKNSTEKRPIASMTKIMTLSCIYDAVESGKITLQEDVRVSARAASMGGSQVFLEAGGVYKAEQLIKSIIVCSANDSCVAMAEHVCGSVESFVDQMNDKAEEWGLVATHFENCTGLPHVSQFSCAKDVAVMLSKIMRYPHYFSCASVWMEDFVHPSGRVTGMTNTNKLVRFYDGCDGGKTGFTNEAMHCLAATAKRGDTRVIAVVVGAESSKTRFKEVSEMFDFAFANYQNKVYVKCGESVQKFGVAGGKMEGCAVASKNLCSFGKKGQQLQMQVELVDNLRAPIAAGQKVGVARLMDGNKIVAEVDLVNQTEIKRKSVWDYVKEIVR